MVRVLLRGTILMGIALLTTLASCGETAKLGTAQFALTTPSVRAVSAARSASTASTLTINKPAGTLQNDVLVAFVSDGITGVLVTAPAGWSLIVEGNNTAGGGTHQAVFYKVAGASEPASYAFRKASGSSDWVGGIYAISGADTTTPIHKFAQAAAANSTTQVTPSVTTTITDCLVLSAFGNDHSDMASYSATGATTGWNLQETVSQVLQGSFYKTQTAAGSVSQTVTLSVARDALAAIVAVAPASTGDTTAPSVPAGLTVGTKTQTSIALSWTASTDNVAVTGYTPYKGGVAQATTTTTSTTFSGLTCGTSYTLTVAAYDAAGNNSAQSTAVAGATTSACSSDTTAPSVPGGLTKGATTTTSIALSWTASTDSVGVTGYTAYRGGVSQGTSTSTSFIFTGLTCGTSYDLTVDAYDAAGNHSVQSTVLSASPSGCGMPNGTACTSAAACTSGFCTDGYCCNVICGQLCNACNVAGSLGTCVVAPLGTRTCDQVIGTACDGVSGTTCPTTTTTSGGQAVSTYKAVCP